MRLHRSWLIAAIATIAMLAGGTAMAGTGEQIDNRDEALAAITDGLALIDAGQAKITAGQEWLVANPPPAPEPEPEPTPTPTPDPEPEPAPITATAAVIEGEDEARVDWATERTDITGWHIGRDGTDTTGYGAWSTDLPAEARTFTFDLLRAGDTYRFTLTPHTAAGPLDPVVTEAAMPGGVEPEPTDPPVTDEPDPTEPPAGDGTEAAVVHGWGTPLAASDEFNYSGAPDPGKWGVYNGPGHDGNGTRDPNRVTVDGNKLVMTGLANGASAGMASQFDQQYGRWEARVRSFNTGPSGNQYHPLLIIWPESNQWPAHGEYDFLENGAPGEQCAEAFLHYPGHTPIRQEHAVETNCGAPLSEWHNVALEWDAGSLTGYIDGKQWFDFGAHDITAMPSGHLAIQLDNFFGGNMTPATYEIDWVRIYAP
ncbi:glycoside hydrolase family 16 protein [Pseudonocardia parietis]|uniref:GH16 domain-containing protein n=1 Tax=Pseudonocardia parietis TaxID=570936 RepID=A0ABS4W216_9PSEU|nr:glycoside hydrolase family 16 protein [Pseudonocardia parietis]MBP2370210.1 hypothetical protein [Pseudonocardia parietis]